LIESIGAHFYITASQGEMGATTVIEALMKGFKPLVLEHPFLSGHYEGAPIYPYNSATDLDEVLLRACTDNVKSEDLRQFALANYSIEKFVDNLERSLRRAVLKVEGGAA
jgi:hypothetical protein